jgi:hypothetical protein
MLQVGDYVGLKPKLTLGRKYGTVTFGKYHVPYLHKLLRVYNISSTGTAYCNHNGYPCECGTFSEPMLNIAKFRIGDIVKVGAFVTDKQQPYVGKVSVIKSIEYKDDSFVYHIVDDCGFFDWSEDTLVFLRRPVISDKKNEVDEKLEDLKPVLEDENQLQGEDSNLRSGEGVQGSRVHGGKGKASIRSRPLRNASRVRGK